MLASASATGDASNADTVSGQIAHGRLIPNDNSITATQATVLRGHSAAIWIRQGC